MIEHQELSDLRLTITRHRKGIAKALTDFMRNHPKADLQFLVEEYYSAAQQMESLLSRRR